LSDQQRAQIEEMGGRVRTAAGTIITLDLPVDALERFTALDVVQYVEPSAPLYQEGPGNSSRE
jgi:hypothetical protein